MPNFRGRRFTNAHETMIWASRSADAKNYTFNYEALKAGNEDCQVRSDWFMPICTGGERLKDDDGRKTASHAEAGSASGARPSCRRAGLAMWCSIPFSGQARQARWPSGCGRSFIGLERDPVYADAARARIAAVEPLPADAVAVAAAKRSEPRVAFASVVEFGPDRAGHYPDGREAPPPAMVRADGALALGPAVGSIHKVGALAQGLPPATAGRSGMWKTKGGSSPSNSLRTIMRSAMREAAE